MGKTLFDKVWDKHVVRSIKDGPDVLFIDRHMVHEVTSPVAFRGLENRNLKVLFPKKLSIYFTLLLLFSIYINGQNSFQEGYNLLVFLILLPVGYILRKVDTLPLIFVFIIQSRLDAVMISFMDLI